MTGTAQPEVELAGQITAPPFPRPRPATDYTARIMVKHDPLVQDLEPGWMLWQK